MSVKVKLNFAQIESDISKAVVAGVNRVTLELGRDMKLMLSRPGSGRLYVKRTAGKGYNKRALKALRRAGIKARSGRFFRSIDRGQAASLLRSMRSGGNRMKLSVGFYKASAPGEPPAVRTGHLRRSWQTAFDSPTKEQSGNKYKLTVGSNLNYARYLEFGTSKIKARPYVRPVVARMRPKAVGIVNDFIAKALNKYRAKP